MSPLILLFSSTPGGHTNKAQGADFNNNDGDNDKGIFLNFPPPHFSVHELESLSLLHDY